MYPTTPTKPTAPAYGSDVLDSSGKKVGTVRYDTNTGKDLTPAQVYKDFKAPSVDPSMSAIDSAISYTQPNTSPINEDQIRQNYMAQFQKEVDAVNSVYTNLLNDSITAGKGRLGSSRAIQARSGTLGSDFGAAQTAQVEDANTKEAQLIEAERASKIAEIMGKARAGAADEIKAKREAQSKGLNDYISFLGSRADRVKSNLSNLSKSIIAQGLDIKDIDPTQIRALAQQYGVSEGDLVASFGEEKKALELQNAKLNPAKERYINLSDGTELYDTQTGKVIAANKKDFAPKATGTGTGTGGGGIGGGKYASDLDALIGSTIATIPTKFGQQQFQSQISKARNDGDKLNLMASTVLKNAPGEIKTDFANQAIGMKSLDKAIALLDSGVKTGKLKAGTQYVFNLAGRDFDPNLARIDQLITAAIQPYRSSVTGAAWGDQEDAEYASLFGDTKYQPDVLKQRLEGVKEIMKSKSAVGLGTFINPLGTYADPFATGALTPGSASGGGVLTAPDGSQIQIID